MTETDRQRMERVTMTGKTDRQTDRQTAQRQKDRQRTKNENADKQTK